MVKILQRVLKVLFFLFIFIFHLPVDNCPMIHIPGFTFPVEEFLLEDIVQMTRLSEAPPK